MDIGKDHILGVLNDVEIVPYKEDITDFISIPFRRTSKYRQLEHGENGFLNTGWKDITTRYNQLKFMNEVKRGYRDTSEDGINNLKYKVHSIIDVANFHHLTVKL